MFLLERALFSIQEPLCLGPLLSGYGFRQTLLAMLWGARNGEGAD